MRDWLRLWFSIARPVGRLPYALTGFGLMPIKFAGDAALIYLATGAAWSPLGYLTPRLASTWAVLAGDRPWLVAVLLLWTLPFLWIGASMTMRRGLDAGFPGAAGLLFFLPVVNYVWMLTLCAFPTARLGRRIDEAPAARASVRLELVAAMPAAVLGLAVALLSIFFIDSYGSALFVGVPFVMGFVSAYRAHRLGLHATRQAILAGQLSLLLVAALLIVFALEGLVCIVMAGPFAVVLALLGSMVGRVAAGGSGATPAQVLLVFLTLPALLGIDAARPAPALREVVTSIEIDAPPDVVWQNVIGFSELPPPNRLVFALGIAHPRRARIEGRGVGAVRHCEFSTGAFVEPISVWDPPHRLAFDVVSQPEPMHEWSPYARVNAPHLLDGLQSRRGEFRLVETSNGRTRLEGSTWYTLDMAPSFYWTLWSDTLIHAIHERVLDHIREVSENPRPAGRAGLERGSDRLESPPREISRG